MIFFRSGSELDSCEACFGILKKGGNGAYHIENRVRSRLPEAEIEGYVRGTFPPQVKPYLAKRVERINRRGGSVETNIPYYGTEGIPWYKQPSLWGFAMLLYFVAWTIYWW